MATVPLSVLKLEQLLLARDSEGFVPRIVLCLNTFVVASSPIKEWEQVPKCCQGYFSAFLASFSFHRHSLPGRRIAEGPREQAWKMWGNGESS
jgi:hypothetical protein